jgi:glycosyltransferase involved in cell wall biosynthesis
LPPLEAMRLGVPAIVSNAGSLPEVCGTAAIQVGVDDARGLAEAIARLVRSKDERAALVAAGRKRAATLTWDAAARATLDAYRRCG